MLSAFYATAVVLLGIAIWLSGGRTVSMIALAVFALLLVWQVRRLDIDDPALCLRLFKSNRDAGLLLFAGLAIDALLQHG
jgi:4-hydroxybenzoate polyprenyltransferase